MYFVFFSIDNQSKDMVGYLQYGGLRHALSKIALPDIIVQNQPLEKPLIYFFHLFVLEAKFIYFCTRT